MIRKLSFLLFKSFQNLDTTWVFNTETEEWSQGPTMNEKRAWHSCFYDGQTKSIFVVGGYNGNTSATTEQWNLDTYQWISTPDLPEPLVNSAGVASKSSHIVGFLAGGYNGDTTDKIYGLGRSDLVWVVMPQKLQTARRDHSMINLPADQIPGC